MDEVGPSLFSDYYHFIDIETTFYEQLAACPELDDPSLTYEALLALCDQICPSLVLGTGGLMFELFILRFGSREHCQLLRSHIRLHAGLYWIQLITRSFYGNIHCVIGSS